MMTRYPQRHSWNKESERRDGRSAQPLLEVRDLRVTYAGERGRPVHAVDSVSFKVFRGETLGLVGESGCGKSSLARAIMQLPPPTSGTVLLDGEDLTQLSSAALRDRRSQLQMVFQDPISSLNPRRRIIDVVAEPLRARGIRAGAAERAAEILDAVGVDPSSLGDRRAGELSGGQCQRVSLARALVLEPSVLVCDEPVSALDVSIQAQVLNLLEDLKEQFNLTMLFIAHDLAVVKNISDHIAVMYLGSLCEVGPATEVYRAPSHPYTDLLLRSVPIPDPTAAVVELDDLPEPPNLGDPPSGCRFRTRCRYATDLCSQEDPRLGVTASLRHAACHHPLTG